MVLWWVSLSSLSCFPSSRFLGHLGMRVSRCSRKLSVSQSGSGPRRVTW
jgi:hypothetical protein